MRSNCCDAIEKPRRLVFTKAFEKAVRRCKASGRFPMQKVNEALQMLTHRKRLPEAFRDHPLVGKWLGYRECHLGGDFLLIYRLDGDEIIIAAMLGSHNDCFS